MAEYFPLLDRAVSGLTDSTAETRRAIYERARAALLGQLRRMDPPVPEEDIARESTALDEAIARVEARVAEAAQKPAPAPPAPAQPAPAPPQPAASPAARPPAPVPPRPPAPATARPSAPPPARPAPRPPAPSEPAQPIQPAAAQPAAPRVPPLPTGTAPPVAPPPSRERPVIGQRPAPSIDSPGAPGLAGVSGAPLPRVPPRPVPAAPARGTRPVMALRPVPPARPEGGAASPDAGAGLPAAGRLAEAAETPESGEAREGASFGAVLDAAGRDDPAAERDEGGSAPAPGATRLRDAPMRPPAPRPGETPRFGWKAAAAGVVALVLMVGIGIAAYRLRDRPDQVVANPATIQAATPAIEVATPGKVAARAGSAAGDVADDAGQASSGAAVPAPVGQNGGDAPAPPASIAVAQRAALLVDAPDDPQRVKTYVGTVVWHLDSVSPGQGQPLAPAVKADIDIPDADLKVSMVMQKNPEPQLPASHTIEFHFMPQAGNTLGPVKQVNVPEMRKDDDAPTGDPLSGVPVAITDNYFLVGLSRGAAESQNLRLLTERNWVDMGILFSSGKLGKLTFEKGAAGQRTIEDALKAWK